ncbi:hypothetical protein [Butyribacter sp.]|uniref:hypothetical protein n=1 Tax=Butyribacter sp. TaxID=2822465 RepID=UPI002AA09AB3|nr:hypothetical protein [Butyribacter sp.]
MLALSFLFLRLFTLTGFVRVVLFLRLFILTGFVCVVLFCVALFVLGLLLAAVSFLELPTAVWGFILLCFLLVVLFVCVFLILSPVFGLFDVLLLVFDVSVFV